MKVLLYILLVLQIISGALLFFIFIASAWYYAFIFLFISILQATLTLVVIDNKNRIENLEFYNDNILLKLKKLENQEKINPTSPIPAVDQNIHVAIGAWQCIKCDTINKAGTTRCSNCQTNYLPEINPTVNPYAKKKRISKWIK